VEEGDIGGAFHLWQERRAAPILFYGLATAAKELGEWEQCESAARLSKLRSQSR